MEKFKTLNNKRCKDIIFNAAKGNYRSVYILIYNNCDLFSDELLQRVINLVVELAPLTLDVYKSLPLNVQSYFNTLWLDFKND